MKLELDIKSILAEELLSDSFILEWGATASRGHFNLGSVSLDISYNKEQHNAQAMYLNRALSLLASGIGIGILKRSSGLLISENN